MTEKPPEVTSKRRPRLTIASSSSSRLAHNANIPQFTHPSSQQSTTTIKALRRPQKEVQDPKSKPKTTLKPRSKSESSKISTFTSSLLDPTSGPVRSLTKKRLEEAEAERRKKAGPLDGPEEGEYDRYGVWQDSSAMEEWKIGTTKDDAMGE